MATEPLPSHLLFQALMELELGTRVCRRQVLQQSRLMWLDSNCGIFVQLSVINEIKIEVG